MDAWPTVSLKMVSITNGGEMPLKPPLPLPHSASSPTHPVTQTANLGAILNHALLSLRAQQCPHPVGFAFSTAFLSALPVCPRPA